MGANKIEKFEMQVINRKDLHKADYNPRKITETAAKKLRKFMRENGLWSPLIVNKRTMNLVSGHQRLEAMDTLLRRDDYDLTVAMVDVDEKEEVTGNVFLNNTSAMGEWDFFKLESLHEIFPEIDFENDFGFDKSELDVMFGKDFFESMQDDANEGGEKTYTPDYYREAKSKIRENARNENESGDTYNLEDIDYQLTIVFPNNYEKREFMKKIRKNPSDKYVKSNILIDIYNHVYNLSVFDTDS